MKVVLCSLQHFQHFYWKLREYMV